MDFLKIQQLAHGELAQDDLLPNLYALLDLEP